MRAWAHSVGCTSGAGLPAAADAKVTFPDGHRDYVSGSHGDLADSPVVAGEVTRILSQPLP